MGTVYDALHQVEIWYRHPTLKIDLRQTLREAIQRRIIFLVCLIPSFVMMRLNAWLKGFRVAVFYDGLILTCLVQILVSALWSTTSGTDLLTCSSRYAIEE